MEQQNGRSILRARLAIEDVHAVDLDGAIAHRGGADDIRSRLRRHGFGLRGLQGQRDRDRCEEESCCFADGNHGLFVVTEKRCG